MDVDKSVRRHRRGWMLAALLAIAMVAGGVFVLRSLGPSEAGIRDLKAEGQALIDGVESYRARTGRYPATLEEAGLSAPWTRYGRWRYGSDGNSYFVEVGDYTKYNFLLYSTDDGWALDT